MENIHYELTEEDLQVCLGFIHPESSVCEQILTTLDRDYSVVSAQSSVSSFSMIAPAGQRAWLM